MPNPYVLSKEDEEKYNLLHTRAREILWQSGEMLASIVFDTFGPKFEALSQAEQKTNAVCAQEAERVAKSRAEKAGIDEAIAQAKTVLANIEGDIAFKKQIEANLQKQLDSLKAEADGLVTQNRKVAWDKNFDASQAVKNASKGVATSK